MCIERFAKIAHQDNDKDDANEQYIDIEALVNGIIQDYLVAIFR